jgi:hypothetical protein
MRFSWELALTFILACTATLSLVVQIAKFFGWLQ